MKKLSVLVFILSFYLFLLSCTSNSAELIEDQDFENDSDLVLEEEIEISEEELIEEDDQRFFEEIVSEEVLSDHRNEPALPSEIERSKLLACDGKHFDNFPVDMNEVKEISPLGNLGPPGHTFPTEHSFIHIGDYETNLIYSLYAPADVTVLHVSKYPGSIDPWEYTIYFALCQDYIGYYNHVKVLSYEFEEMLSSYECEQWTEQAEGSCAKNVFFEIESGMEIGLVGAKQGNFDFGMMDLTIEHEYANPERNGGRTPHIVCAYEYYPNEMRDVFFDLIERDDTEQCGITAQDKSGTLQGNWYFGDSTSYHGDGWDQYLAFVYDNEEPDVQVVSVGGMFTDSGKWEFYPNSAGLINRNFADVIPSDVIYCYEAEETDRWRNDPLEEGRILVQLIDSDNLLIEHQDKSCSNSEYLFDDPSKYSR